MQGGHARHSDISGCYGALLPFLTVVPLPSKIIKSFRLRTRGRLSLGDALLERLPQDLQDMAAARRPCIQEEDVVVGPRPLAWPRPVAPADQPRSGDGVVRGPKGAR
jgi:hypothetical protein